MPDYLEPFLGGAGSVPIWDVARATSAVPYYFNIATIHNEKYRDAGAGFNNPSLEAFAEINAIHRRCQNNTDMPTEHEALALEDTTQHQTDQQGKREAEEAKDPRKAIAVFVSIGSGKRPLQGLRTSKAIPGLSTIEGIPRKEYWAIWTSTEKVHEEMER